MNRSVVRNLSTICMCLLLILAGGIIFQGKSLPSSAKIENKKLPVYCVKCETPKVSISFDAAWGNGRLRENNCIAIVHIKYVQRKPVKIVASSRSWLLHMEG